MVMKMGSSYESIVKDYYDAFERGDHLKRSELKQIISDQIKIDMMHKDIGNRNERPTMKISDLAKWIPNPNKSWNLAENELVADILIALGRCDDYARKRLQAEYRNVRNTLLKCFFEDQEAC